ncbi:hypothetical protein J7I80_11300 [Bacillus sp. ISL-41]|uniref:hypothetical protein n=1 Tax=Bacillus sp. ISL-41 TaxID=2819127 RepID=UPI001BEC6436|nr:hypothetical protein [Bacillus sp. ISL-41]MBT2642815.1 hypothetical protein [Bacillus sp. ISL-41]
MLYQKVMIAGMLSLLFLSACSSEISDPEAGGDNNAEIEESQNKDDQDSVGTDSKEDQDSAETATQPAEDNQTTAKAAEDAISFIEKQYTKGDIQVEYPQLPDADSVEVQSINEVISRDATYFFENGLYEGYSGDIKYETTFLDEEVASFLYQGLLTSPKQSYPLNLSYSTIVNRQTGEKVTLSDLVTVDEAFVDKIKQGKILSSSSVEYSDEVKNYLSSLGNEQLLNELSKADTMDSSTFTYLKDDSIVVIVGVPHALGDFVHVEISK